ncbi:hypothetical protein JGUZn3_12310 [Entomobacter blattae]|uniref:Uncharacterized protein n=1 Tax=Entomobacter blattae TaxID=2762277 RepID=A0A7H1NRP7_9PROT|nr:hypothetical protein JGUZn3_12310 [Entomobacter blattae]
MDTIVNFLNSQPIVALDHAIIITYFSMKTIKTVIWFIKGEPRKQATFNTIVIDERNTSKNYQV